MTGARTQAAATTGRGLPDWALLLAIPASLVLAMFTVLAVVLAV